MPRRPQPLTLRLAAIKAVGRYNCMDCLLSDLTFEMARHLERICYGCRSSQEVKLICVLQPNMTNVSKIKLIGLKFIICLFHECISVPASHWEWWVLEGGRSFCKLATLIAGRPTGRGAWYKLKYFDSEWVPRDFSYVPNQTDSLVIYFDIGFDIRCAGKDALHFTFTSSSRSICSYSNIIQNRFFMSK